MAAKAAADLRRPRDRRKALAAYKRLYAASTRMPPRQRRDYVLALSEQFRRLMTGGTGGVTGGVQ